MPLLHHERLEGSAKTKAGTVVFLHGILGMGSNWRSFARALVERLPNWDAVLVDLRMHGASLDFPPPHTLATCAGDVSELIASFNDPQIILAGHSFGGKIALLAASEAAKTSEVWLLDSRPSGDPAGGRVQDGEAVLRILDGLADRKFVSRTAFREHLKDHGLGQNQAQWLSLNLEEHEGVHRLAIDPTSIRPLLEDFAKRDLWSVAEKLKAKLYFVIAENSGHYNQDDRQKAEALVNAQPGRVALDILPDAGHWLHSDNPKGLLELFVERLKLPA